MSESTAASVVGQRLNPFAFPSETTLRFVLLIVFVLCGSARLYGNMEYKTDKDQIQCGSQMAKEILELSKEPPNSDHMDEVISARLMPVLSHCLATMRPEAEWKIVGMCLVLVAAAGIYLAYPGWLLRMRRLRPISGLPELEQELHALVATAHLKDSPIFVWNPVAIGLPIVFGRGPRYYVALSGWFVARFFHRDRGSFRAIMLHELAHIHNGDVPKTYLTVSLSLAFVVFALAPSLLIVFWHLAFFRWGDAVLLLVGIIPWAVVIVLSGMAVLRAREFYADVRASSWEKDSQVDRALAALRAPTAKGWSRYLRFHPDPSERRKVLQDPSILLKLGFADALGIGIATWSIVSVISGLLVVYAPLKQSILPLAVAAGVVVVPTVVFILALGAIGIGVWRAAFSSLLQRAKPYAGTGWLAIAFVAGGSPGVILSLAETTLQFSDESSKMWTVLVLLLSQTLNYVVVMVACLLLFRWISETASAWFEVVLQSRSPRPVLLISVATALVLVVGTFAVVLLYTAISILAPFWREEGVYWLYSTGLVFGTPIVIGSIAVWAFPLSATFWQPRTMSVRPAPWVYLDGGPLEVPVRRPISLRAPLLVGMVTGLLFWFWWELVFLRRHLPADVSDGVHRAFEWLFALMKDSFGDGSVILPGSAAAFQVSAAVVASVLAPRLGAICGLFAAFVCGFIISVGHCIFFMADLEFNASREAIVIASMMGMGGILALPMTIVASRLADAYRSHRTVWAGAGLSAAPGGIRQSSAAGARAGHLAAKRLFSGVSKGCFAALCIVVAIGMAAKFHDEALIVEANGYRKTAEQGDGEAQYRLGVMYAQGNGVRRDSALATHWLRLAAQQGHSSAKTQLTALCDQAVQEACSR